MLPSRPIFFAGCKSQIGSWDIKSTINKTIYCRKCRIYNLYRVDTGETEITNKPERMTGSGMTFY